MVDVEQGKCADGSRDGGKGRLCGGRMKRGGAGEDDGRGDGERNDRFTGRRKVSGRGRG